MSQRTLQTVIESIPTSDGAGVRLRRSIGSRRGLYLDPFLMLDEFSSDDPDDYIAGFPPHPHRGFETVTYMLDGRMRHEDHLGNTGDLGPGGVQWMTAARGIIHSEMPQQDEGRMRGFQLWINLPAAEKMKPAGYRDIPADSIPEHSLPDDGGTIRVIAGTLRLDEVAVHGAVNADGSHSTDPLYLDITLSPGQRIELNVANGHSAFVYSAEGSIDVGVGAEGKTIPEQAAGVLGPGERLTLTAGSAGARTLVLAARPIGEPIVQYGPFVMNTREEIDRAIEDYRNGTLAVAD